VRPHPRSNAAYSDVSPEINRSIYRKAVKFASLAATITMTSGNATFLSPTLFSHAHFGNDFSHTAGYSKFAIGTVLDVGAPYQYKYVNFRHSCIFCFVNGVIINQEKYLI
jgi:hypothetical protein